MLVDPLIVKIAGSLIGLLILLLGCFLNRTLNKQDERNKQQDETNRMLQKSIEDLNKTMATVVEGFQWFQDGCAERHSKIGIKRNCKRKPKVA